LVHLDYSVAGVLSATIDAQDSHVSAVYRGKEGDTNPKTNGTTLS
jgi:hypothetical protein